jgi:hypothetical protein
MAYIPIDRDIVNHWIYSDNEYFKVWFHMLHSARFSKEPVTIQANGDLIELGYGEFIFGRKKWSEEHGISEQRLRTLIKRLTDEGMIELSRQYRKSSVYLVKNYSKYNHQSNHQINHQETQAGQGFEVDANHQSNHQDNQLPTTKQPPNNHSLIKKEREEGKKEDLKESLPNKSGDDFADSFETFWTAYPSKKGKAAAKTSWSKKVIPLLQKGEVTMTEIVEGVARYKAYCEKTDRPFKDGSTAVNGMIWLDDWAYDGMRYGGKASAPAENMGDRLKRLGGQDHDPSRSRKDITPNSGGLSTGEQVERRHGDALVIEVGEGGFWLGS